MTMNKLILTTLLLSSMIANPSKSAALECPDSIRYSNGQQLKSGNNFYYNNGQLARSANTLYHSNGQRLQTGSSIYYSSGQYFKSGTTLYYPNSQYLRFGTTWYYQNSQYLKFGSSYYYSNGKYARFGETLYRADGSRTDFPITLRADIGPGAFYLFNVEKSSDAITARLERFSVANGVNIALVEVGESFSSVFTFNTGHPGENITAEFDANGTLTRCTINDQSQPERFQLEGAAAKVDVIVKPGFDPQRVKRALQEALDSL